MSPHTGPRMVGRAEQHGSRTILWIVRLALCAVALCMALASHQLYARLSPRGKGTGSQSLRSLSWIKTSPQKRLDVNPWPDAYFVPWLEGMDPLPDIHGPDSEEWDNSFAICSIMKDENITDVREWLTYYRWMGVSHVFLTDNNSQGGKEMVEKLKLEFPPSFLTLQVEEMEHAQMKHYAWCAEEQRGRFNWMGFFDMDEFLYINGADLATFMDSYKTYPALSVHWIWVGPDGHAARPATGGVLPYYTLCSAEADRHVKTIVNTYFLEGLEIHPHNFHYRDDKNAVDENFKEILPMWKGRWEFKKTGGTDDECGAMGEQNDPEVGKQCFLSAGAIGEPATATKIALYHYATKSLADFSEKMHRGSGMSKGSKGMDYFAEISRLQTRSAWCRLPATTAAKCCKKLYPEAVKDLTSR